MSIVRLRRQLAGGGLAFPVRRAKRGLACAGQDRPDAMLLTPVAVNAYRDEPACAAATSKLKTWQSNRYRSTAPTGRATKLSMPPRRSGIRLFPAMAPP